jgi:hypothetical protein
MFKKKVLKEDNLVLLHGECDNCGAPLKYNKETLECKCEYCRTEYYVTNDGIIEGMLIRLKIHGKEKVFYIGREEYHKIFGNDTCRDINGRLMSNCIAVKMKLELIEV